MFWKHDRLLKQHPVISASWYSCPSVISSPRVWQFSLAHSQQIAYSRNGRMSSLRSGYKKVEAFHVGALFHSFSLMELSHRGEESCLHSKEQTCLIKSQREHKTTNSTWVKLEGDPAPLEPSADFIPSRYLDCSLMRALEPEASAKSCPGS